MKNNLRIVAASLLTLLASCSSSDENETTTSPASNRDWNKTNWDHFDWA